MQAFTDRSQMASRTSQTSKVPQFYMTFVIDVLFTIVIYIVMNLLLVIMCVPVTLSQITYKPVSIFSLINEHLLSFCAFNYWNLFSGQTY